MTDALGNLVRFVLLPGQRYDTIGVAPLIEEITFDALIADKADWIINEANERGAKIVISQPQPQGTRRNRRENLQIAPTRRDFFCKLKEFTAMRADETATSFKALIYLCAAVIESR